MTRFLLPNGAELRELPGARVKPSGDRGLMTPVVYRHPGAKGAPSFEVTLDVWDGVPVCTEVAVKAKPDQNIHIRVKDVKYVADELETLIEQWLPFVAYRPLGKPGQWVQRMSDEERAESLKYVRAARKQVRRRGNDHVEAVAKTYNAASKAKTEAVAAAFGVSYRTAQRYIDKARKADLIDE